LASSRPIKGQARVLQRGRTTKKYKRQQARRKIEIDISSNHPCSLFPLFETWARHPLSHACNPYTSTSVQGNTNFSPPLDVGPSLARTRINPVCSPCITIQERDTQYLLVGLGPPRVRTPTLEFNKMHFELN
jgi:hypothetical protein